MGRQWRQQLDGLGGFESAGLAVGVEQVVGSQGRWIRHIEHQLVHPQHPRDQKDKQKQKQDEIRELSWERHKQILFAFSHLPFPHLPVRGYGKGAHNMQFA